MITHSEGMAMASGSTSVFEAVKAQISFEEFSEVKKKGAVTVTKAGLSEIGSGEL